VVVEAQVAVVVEAEVAATEVAVEAGALATEAAASRRRASARSVLWIWVSDDLRRALSKPTGEILSTIRM